MWLNIMCHAATIPQLINYQGHLTTPDNGIPFTGSKKFEFNIYDAAIGGTLIWGPQIFNSVPVIQGTYNIILGTTDSVGRSIADAFNEAQRFIAVTIDDGEEIKPRQQVLSSPYTLHAGVADYADQAGHAATATTADNAKNSEYASKSINFQSTSLKGLNQTSARFYGDNNLLMIIPCLGNHGYNPHSSEGDIGIIWKDSQKKAGFVIGPHSANAVGLKIKADGNVGIGTSQPKSKLHVAGSTTLDDSLKLGLFEILEKGGNNGTASCSTFCAGSQWGAWSGSCIAAFKNGKEPVTCDTVTSPASLKCLCIRVP
jgi:hypothetical protein